MRSVGDYVSESVSELLGSELFCGNIQGLK